VQFPAGKSGAILLVNAFAVVSETQLAALDPDMLDVIQVAVGESDELTFDIRRAGALDL